MMPRKRFPYTGVAYALSGRGATALLDITDRYGFLQAADMMRIKLLDLIDGCYATDPLLVHLPRTVVWRGTKAQPMRLTHAHAQDGGVHAGDSDVQLQRNWIPGTPRSIIGVDEDREIAS